MENALAAWIRGTINQCLLCLFLLISTICIYSILRNGQLEDEQEVGKPRISYKIEMLAVPCVTLGVVIASVSVMIWSFMAGRFAPTIISNSSLGLFHVGTLPFCVLAVLIMVLATVTAGIVTVQSSGHSR